MEHKSPTQTFPKFLELPREIRLMIWEAALPGPRVVGIRHLPLDMTIEEWNRKTEAERAAITGRPADSDSLYACIEAGYGPQRHFQIRKPSGLLVSNLERDMAEFNLHMEEAGPTSIRRIHYLRVFKLVTAVLVKPSIIYFHLSQGIPIHIMQSYLGLSTEKDLFDLLLVGTTTIPRINSPTGKQFEAIRHRKKNDMLAQQFSRVKSNCHPICVLSVCRESREVALRSYNKIFRTAISPAATQFNFEHDTLYLRHWSCSDEVLNRNIESFPFFDTSRLYDIDTVEKIRSLALSFDYLRKDRTYDLKPTKGIVRLLGVFTKVKELTLVLNHFGQDIKAPCIFVDPQDLRQTRLLTGLVDPEDTNFESEILDQRWLEDAVNAEAFEAAKIALALRGISVSRESQPRVIIKCAISPSVGDLDWFEANWRSYMRENIHECREWFQKRKLPVRSTKERIHKLNHWWYPRPVNIP